MDLKGFDLEHWWKLLAAAGALLAIAAVATSNSNVILIGLGLLLVGVGEWINHPLQTTVVPGWKITGYPWRASIGGVILDLAGIGLFGIGLVKLLLG